MVTVGAHVILNNLQGSPSKRVILAYYHRRYLAGVQ